MNTDEIPLSREEKTSIYITAGLAVTGYIISTFTCDDVFPRFGALIVCTGVLFGVKGLTITLDHASPIFEAQFKKIKEKLDVRYQKLKGKAKDEELTELRENSLQHIKDEENKIKRMLYSIKKRILYVEGRIIAFGTLVWGFGDYTISSRYLLGACNCSC